jgi:hypothetical protein
MDLASTNGLYDFTLAVLAAYAEQGGAPLPKIEEHESGDAEGADFLWYQLTPELDLSEGEYIRISPEAGRYYVSAGMRGCCGGDPTFDGDFVVDSTPEGANKVALELLSIVNQRR